MALVLVLGFGAGVVTQEKVGFGNLRERIARPKVEPNFEVPKRHQGRIRLFLLAGQSNMEGGGDLEDYEAPPHHIANRIYVFTKDYTWQPAREPLSKSGVGPAVAFAARLLSLDPDPTAAVGLIPAARGGTNIAKWLPSSRDGDLYAEMLKRASAARVQGTIEGFLMFQGENDTEGKPDDHPEDWSVMFAKVVRGVRADVDNPELPVVFAQLGKPLKPSPAWESVKEEQARTKIDGVAMIRTEDLPYGDSIHFTTKSYLEIGRRFADAMHDLQEE